jgi:hypothetical protein
MLVTSTVAIGFLCLQVSVVYRLPGAIAVLSIGTACCVIFARSYRTMTRDIFNAVGNLTTAVLLAGTGFYFLPLFLLTSPVLVGLRILTSVNRKGGKILAVLVVVVVAAVV